MEKYSWIKVSGVETAAALYITTYHSMLIAHYLCVYGTRSFYYENFEGFDKRNLFSYVSHKAARLQIKKNYALAS